MDFDGEGVKGRLLWKNSAVIIAAILFLVLSLFFVFRDSGGVEENSDQNLENDHETEIDAGEGGSLDDYFEREFDEQRKTEDTEDENLSSEETCTLDGLTVKEGTIVSGTTCTAPGAD